MSKIAVYVRNQPTDALPAHRCTPTLAALISELFPRFTTYLPEERRLLLHTADSFTELKNRVRGRKNRAVVEIRDARPGMPLITSWADQREQATS
jgi:hypothetical protein